MQNERLHAIKNLGVFLNDLEIEREILPQTSEKILLSAIIPNSNKIKLATKIAKFERLPSDYGSVVYNTMMTILERAKASIIIDLAIWDIASFVLIAEEMGIKTKWISKFPDIHVENILDYCHSLVLGEIDERIFE